MAADERGFYGSEFESYVCEYPRLSAAQLMMFFSFGKAPGEDERRKKTQSTRDFLSRALGRIHGHAHGVVVNFRLAAARFD